MVFVVRLIALSFMYNVMMALLILLFPLVKDNEIFNVSLISTISGNELIVNVELFLILSFAVYSL